MKAAGPKLRVTYHDPCHLVKGQKISAQPRNVLKAIPGVEYVETPRRERLLRRRRLLPGGACRDLPEDHETEDRQHRGDEGAGARHLLPGVQPDDRQSPRRDDPGAPSGPAPAEGAERVRKTGEMRISGQEDPAESRGAAIGRADRHGCGSQMSLTRFRPIVQSRRLKVRTCCRDFSPE